jgi:HK97 family phage major capsid protein/HK97 family phage prohead protease
MLDRAYSLLQIKSVDEDARILEGVATSVTPDRLEDVVEPRGASFKLPVPFLWMHGKRQPAIGHVIRANVTDEGIAVRVQIEKDDQPGPLKDMLDLAWRSIQKGLVRGLSIGFRPLESPEPIKGTMGLRFKKWEWLELSAVTIPAHQDASISLIKSLTSSDASHAPGTTGTQTVKTVRKTPMTTAESIKQFSERKDAILKDMEAIMTASNEKGETLDADQDDKYEAMKNDLASIDKHLNRLHDYQEVMKATARPANGGTIEDASNSRGSRQPVITVTPNQPPGIGFARVAIAKYMSWMDHVPAREIVAERWPDDNRLKQYFSKAAVPAAVTTNATYAGNLVYADNLASEFVEFLRPMTLVGRLPLRKVPFNIRFASQTTGAVANWVGEGRGKPVTSASTGTGSLGFTKIAAIAVISQEMARFSSPNAETWMRDELAAAVTERLDIDFIDPAQAAVAGINPASITNGLTALSSAGTSADNIRTDLQNLLEQFILNNMGASGVVLIMPETLALAASLLTNAFGQPEFPSLTPTGGTLRGIPVFTTQYAANQSGSGNLVIALKPNEIALADDGGVDVSVSTEASLEMSDAPTNRSDTPTAASLVSLWQTNSIGIKAERFVNWTKRRSTAVVYMDDVNWGAIGSPS